MAGKDYIENLFNSIAPAYDRLNRLMSFGTDMCWRRRAVRHLQKFSGDVFRILDVATGTGDFAIDCANYLKGQVEIVDYHIVGIDLSERMLNVGKRKLEKNRLSAKIDLQVADSEELPFETASFDAVTVAFGVRNFEHLEKGLSEIHRVLTPDGRFLILELSYPDSSILLWMYKLYALHLIPFLCGMFSGNRDAYTYLPQSILNFPKSSEFVRILNAVGFSKVKEYKYAFGACRLYVAEK